MEEIFLNHKSDKRTVASFYKEVLQLNMKRQPNYNRQKYEQVFLQNIDIKMTNKPMKGYSTSLVIWEMQNKMNMRYLCTLTKMTTIKTDNNKC